MGKIVAGFVGVGKTTMLSKVKGIEVEYWKYSDDHQYLKDVISSSKKYDYVFVNTDDKALSLLEGLDVVLVYPCNSLRNEYLDRFIERNSDYEFIGKFMTYWHDRLNHLKRVSWCKNHIVLKQNQYLSDVI